MTDAVPHLFRWLKPGALVWYQASPGSEHRYAGVVDGEPMVLGGHTWVVNLRDMEPRYRDGARTTVSAAACHCLTARQPGDPVATDPLATFLAAIAAEPPYEPEVAWGYAPPQMKSGTWHGATSRENALRRGREEYPGGFSVVRVTYPDPARFVEVEELLQLAVDRLSESIGEEAELELETAHVAELQALLAYWLRRRCRSSLWEGDGDVEHVPGDGAVAP